jgi:hypothetical protein
MVVIIMTLVLPVLQAACKALAVLLAGSGAAKQQCLCHCEAGGPAWPEVAEGVQQVNWVLRQLGCTMLTAALQGRTASLRYSPDLMGMCTAVTQCTMDHQVLRTLPTRIRTLGEKALQQVEQALQGGPQADMVGAAGAGAPVPHRSQADADVAMQMLLVIVGHSSVGHQCTVGMHVQRGLSLWWP